MPTHSSTRKKTADVCCVYETTTQGVCSAVLAGGPEEIISAIRVRGKVRDQAQIAGHTKHTEGRAERVEAAVPKKQGSKLTRRAGEQIRT